jgi:hypothetical protein
VKERWHQYLEVKNERDQLNQLTSLTPHDRDRERWEGEGEGTGEGHSDSDDDLNPESNLSFARLSANSMITAQRWPWTQLVELTTDRKFYRNEIEQCYQFNTPKEFEEQGAEGQHTSQSEAQDSSSEKGGRGNQQSQKRRVGVVSSSQGMAMGTANRQGGAAATAEGNDSNSSNGNGNMFLREKFNRELQSRRHHFQNNFYANRDRERDVYGAGAGAGGREEDEEDEEEDEVTKTNRKKNQRWAGFEPPPNAPLESLSHSSAGEYWREVASLQRKVAQDVSSPWYDAHVLLQRLRRLDDMKAFLDQYNAMMQHRAATAAGGGAGGGGNGNKGRRRFQSDSGHLPPSLPSLSPYSPSLFICRSLSLSLSSIPSLLSLLSLSSVRV